MGCPLPCYHAARRPSPGASAMFLHFMSLRNLYALYISQSAAISYSSKKKTREMNKKERR
jgi:hypothetical protein